MTDTEEITFVELYAHLLRRKWFIITTTAVLTLASLGASLVLPKSYRATVLVTPAQHMSAEGSLGPLHALSSTFGGLASFAGLSTGASNQTAIDVATLKSHVLLNKFIRQNQLLPLLLKSSETKDAFGGKANISNAALLWEASERFRRKVLDVSVDRKTGLVSVSIIWKDPVIAAQWANELVSEVNSYLRNRTIAESLREVKYLKTQVHQTSDVTIKSGVYALIQQQISRGMLAAGKREYALRIIDPAFAPQVAYSPKPVLWTLAGFLAGVILSIGAALTRAVSYPVV